MALGWLWWRAWFPDDAVGAAALCVAGVALGDIHLHFAWQAWHLTTSTFTLCGRCRTHGTGLALVARLVPRWLRGRPSLCMAGVALGNIDRHFAWPAWHLLTSTFTLRGMRGTYGTGLALVPFGSQMTPWAPRLFAWQAWHLATSTFTLRGRRATWRHRPSLCVAGVLALVARLVPRWRRGRRSSLRGRRGAWWHPPSFTHPLSHTTLSPTSFDTPSFTHNFFTHHLWHTTLSTTIFHTPSFTHHLWHTLFHTSSLSHTILHTPPFTHHLSRPTLSHTIFHTPSFTQHFVTHHLWHTIFHTTLSHTIFHTPLCHTPSLTHHLWHTIFDTPSFTPSFTHRHRPIFRTPLCLTPSFTTPSFTHHFVTHHLSPHHLSHTTLSHTIFHAPLCLTPSFTTPSFTHHSMSHTIFHHTIFHTPLCHPPSFATPSFPYNFVTHTHNFFCTSRSSTTSFVFPFFPVPATTFGAHSWKKLPCGVIWSFNYHFSVVMPLHNHHLAQPRHSSWRSPRHHVVVVLVVVLAKSFPGPFPKGWAGVKHKWH